MRHDAIIIGGSFAGLSAATYLARARRSVLIIDTGLPRNRFAAHSHGLLTQDGGNPAAMLAAARAQVAAYPTTTFINAMASRAAKTNDGFAVTLASGATVEAARLVLAFGIADELPAIPGLLEGWGKSVLHCPYCHGFEFSGQRLGVLHASPMSIHQAMLVAEWGPTTLYLDGAAPDDAALDDLRKRGVTIEPAPMRAVHGQAGQISAIELMDGRMADVDALYVSPRTRMNSDIARDLGCDLEEGPSGLFIRTDAQKVTSAPGVYAAGDITRAAHTVTWACADGVMAGMAAHRSLVF